jgi:hypothetical protein
MTTRYLSYTEVAERIRITTGALGSVHLPEPDALIGKTRGWTADTIDRWHEARPRKGVGGRRREPPR